MTPQTENSGKIILDLCGGTGAWSQPHWDAGYPVYNITLPKFDVLEWPLALAKLKIDPTNVHGVLAAPPCTEFSLAKNNTPRDFKKGMEIVRACLDCIWWVRENGNLKWWALENPRGFLRQFLGVPPFTFEQWEFGDEGIKPTDLWGYYKMPTKSVKVRPPNSSKKYPNGRSNAKGWSKSAEKRAITPAGFANAFFKANQ